ncbi:bacitracin transport system permease protein [Halobacillus karajensis]|uniref:Bacitracin export permease protein BceB n=1 Tax=Halobacillus karajensis TaxID=195088 RepID=A0A059NX85_9BACI|nr:ABC transporter permease [Halobacillus karajensis]CDQ18543.1 Bacitracin export permease protein BceB [Halobacillus karajensis]CDQ23385.1 Bacitracin export permease protein BceB [Halobacillus karajensis]CDQ26867.1 Bacitracin export permease protein BceB [Halobacillus karajensis]SEH50137.1 bacitracin transport system permease protein [Halobacillus karajensis]
MNINQLIYRNLKKNLKNYYLYVFALIFSVALYFSFVTLQYDPSMSMDSSLKGEAAMRVASVLLIAIVAVFLLYANRLFIKRRSKEIGLFQLIGMTKNRIFRILSVENLIIYFGSIAIGIFIGFAISKLILMSFFRVVGVDEIANLHFSIQAFSQTLLVFAGIYLVIMTTNYLFIRRQSILALFRVTSSAQGKVKKLSIWEHIMGVLGIGLIASGYYVSSQLFEGDFTTVNSLFGAMAFVLAAVIGGTYFLYKGSVRFVSNLIRKNKKGYLNINEVLSLSSIMFRMKSNAFLLTIITTVSALAIGLLSLSYISYYSAEKSAQNSVPDDFAITDPEQAEEFSRLLEEAGITSSKKEIEVYEAAFNIKDILDANLEELNFDTEQTSLPVISETAVENITLEEGQMKLTGYTDLMQSFISLHDGGTTEIHLGGDWVNLDYQGLEKDYVLSSYYVAGGLPIAVIDETLFNELSESYDPDLQTKPNLYTGINLGDSSKQEEAYVIFEQMGLNKTFEHGSQWHRTHTQKQNMGLVMFIVGFLGLTFLITSGCVLYFKQMDEGEDEKGSYTILRKLGFTRGDLLRGIQGKQLFNFGIPLLIGLLHSYFAVKSGWFFFGTELWTPMFIVMGLYTALYSIFGLLSVLYYKKIIKEAL